MNFDKNGCKLASGSKYDLLEMSITLNGESETGLYLLLDGFNKNSDCLRVLPMKDYLDFKSSEVSTPAISMPSYMIDSCRKVDDESILYFVNNSNPHIIGAIKKYFKKMRRYEQQRSRENKEYKI